MASTRTTSTSHSVVAVVPVKSFAAAKARLSPVLDPAQRQALAAAMAARVIEAAGPALAWVVCDDPTVADFARSHGAEVCWTPGLGLNGAVAEALDRLSHEGVDVAVVTHADVPFAHDLAALAVPDTVVLVPDRHGKGTNVMAVPTGAGFQPAYGPSSFHRHRAEAERLALPVQVLHDTALAWDVDVPDDLWPPRSVGSWPTELPRPQRHPVALLPEG
ncbi:MAG: 2-phospho-L-lactate guanylyltransferase [Microthrixaceae bacterium]